MNTPPDPALRALLRRADPAADHTMPAPADFASAVHARIAASGDPLPFPSSLLRVSGLGRQLFPLAAALALLASLGAGSAAAYARERETRSEFFAAAYARSIDPWQMHAARSEPERPGHH
jgi:hypothetical protein